MRVVETEETFETLKAEVLVKDAIKSNKGRWSKASQGLWQMSTAGLVSQG